MIQVQNLKKTYRVAKKASGLSASLRSLVIRRFDEVHAVKDISFVLREGERVGFLGPNGAGKTTTLKMLAGLLTPSAGRLSVAGLDPRHRPPALLSKISLVTGQKQQLLWDLPPIDTLDLNRAIYQIAPSTYRNTLEQLTEMLELQDLLEKPTRQLSLGERMKCELAAALVHQPRVLFLDEPTIGLDVTMQATVRAFIRAYNEKTGATILLTSHYMEDVAALCPRVIVIDKGALRYDGPLDELVERTHAQKLIRVRFDQAQPLHGPDNLQIAGRPLQISERTPLGFTVLSAPSELVDVVKILLSRLPVTDLRVEDPPLEDVMRHIFSNDDPPVTNDREPISADSDA